MNKKFLRIAAAGLTVLLLCTLSLPVFSYELAYTLCFEPDLSRTEGVFSTYVISFCTPSSSQGTNWALANFSPYVSKASAERYPDLQPEHSWSGGRLIYMQADSRSAVFSASYSQYTKDGKTSFLSPEQLYPKNNASFGEYTPSFQTDYPFKDDHWYTMVLHAWEEPSRATTLMGQWFLDEETGVWTLTNCIDTKYVQSGLTGSFAAFMENYVSSKREGERSFNIKGIYARNQSDGVWNSINTATISGDSLSSITPVGNYQFGAEDSYFWGKSDGTALDDQTQFDSTRPQKETFSITQPEVFSAPGALTATDLSIQQARERSLTVSWKSPETATPLYFLSAPSS